MAQLLDPTDRTGEASPSGKLWLEADPPACPFFRAPLRERSAGALPARPARHLRAGRARGDANPALSLSTHRQREHRRRTGKRLPQFAPPEWLCPGVGLVGVVRFVPLS